MLLSYCICRQWRTTPCFESGSSFSSSSAPSRCSSSTGTMPSCTKGWGHGLNGSVVHTTLLLHPFNGLFSRAAWVSQYQKGKISPDLNEARDGGVWGWQWHQLDHMQTVFTWLQTDSHTNTSSLNFYRLKALPDAQLAVSKHWRHSTVGGTSC